MNGRHEALDWLKAIGMLLIVFGHVAAWAPGATLPPINTKQLGVAFFVFASGYTLAVDPRSEWRLAFRRLFDVYVLTAALAFIVGAGSFLVAGTIQRSNLLPLIGGVNVVFEFFPANPTTWYVGTYIHLILLAAFTHRGWTPSWSQLMLVAAAEVGVRALLMGFGLREIPYMLVSNWMVVYTLGRMAVTRPKFQAAWLPPLTLASLAVLWISAPVLEPAFPFWLPATPGVTSWLTVSLAVTVLYGACTVMAYSVLVRIRVPVIRPFRFVADHTLLIFLAHMPVYYALRGMVAEATGSRPLTALVLFAACLLIPGVASAAVHRSLALRALRGRVEHALFG